MTTRPTDEDRGPAAAPAVPALNRALYDEHRDVVAFAAQALGKIGPEAESALPVLRRRLQDPPPHTETTLRWAIQKITAPPSIE